MSRKYTHEQKLQYLKDGYEFVRSGKGFYKTDFFAVLSELHTITSGMEH